jgi:hypothetical protein
MKGGANSNPLTGEFINNAWKGGICHEIADPKVVVMTTTTGCHRTTLDSGEGMNCGRGVFRVGSGMKERL